MSSHTDDGPVRILQVIDSLDIGGSERHVVELAIAIRQQGREVVVACSAGGPWRDALEAADVEVRVVAAQPVKRRSDPQFTAGLRRLLREQAFDLVHAHLYASSQAAAAAVHETGVPLVVTHHSEETWQGQRERRASAHAGRRAGRVIAVSRPIGAHLTRELHIPACRVMLVPNAIRTHRAATPRNSAGPRIGMVARLSAEKGLFTFLQAAALMARREPGCRFTIVGDGALRGAAQAFALRLGLSRHVEFLGGQVDARPIIAGFDLLAVPSVTEGSPLVILEAMAAGVPVVATSVGGIPDQMQHGREGLLVPPGDPCRLAAAGLRLLNDAALRRRLGEAGRRRIARELPHQGMVQAVTSIYAEVLAVSVKL